MSTTPPEQAPGADLEARVQRDPNPATSRVTPAVRRRLGLGGALNVRASATLTVFVVLAIFFNAKSGGVFLTANNINLLIRQMSVLAVVAAGTTAIMVMGEIDLSIGSAIYLTGLLAAKADVNWHLPLLAVILVAIGGGLVLGAFQGFCVAFLGMPSFIVTLGGLLAFRGIGEAWSGAASNGFANLTEGSVANIVTWLGLAVIGVVGLVMIARGLVRRHYAGERASAIARALGRLLVLAAAIAACIWVASSVFGLPTAAVWIVGVGGVLWLLLARTVFGRDAYLIGSNREAAFRAGLAVRRNIFVGFLLLGVIYGIGGALLTARLDGSTSTAGVSYELFAIASAVLGGISLRGGVGAVPGVIGEQLSRVVDLAMKND